MFTCDKSTENFKTGLITKSKLFYLQDKFANLTVEERYNKCLKQEKSSEDFILMGIWIKR